MARGVRAFDQSWRTEIRRMERTRRKYPRKRVYLPVDCTSAGGTQATRAWTLGGGGMFLAITEKIPAGSELTVRFRPAPHLPAIDVKARVCYQVPNQGVGVEFTDIHPEHRDMILLLVGQRLSEKRRFRRVPLAVQVEHEGGSFLGTSKDVSAGGMFIETGSPVSAYTDLRVRFNLDDGGPVVRAAVEVRYAVENHGIGVRFTEISAADRDRIDAYVRRGEPGP